MRIIRLFKELFNFKKLITVFKIVKNFYFNNYSKYPNYVISFEKEISKKFNAKYCLSFANATIATQTAMRSIGLEKKSKILVSKICFPSTFISILRSGFEPVIADFDKDLNVDLNEKILNADIKAFCISHIFGYPIDIKNIEKLKKNFQNIKIISDCSHAHGAMIGEKNIVNFSDISIMSLQGAKAISGGEGGVAFTNNINYFNSMIELSHPSRNLTDGSRIDNFPGFSKLIKGRMHPFAAILASYDLHNLDRKNKELKKKIKLIYKILKNVTSIYLPNINIEETGGYHYGIPLIFNKNKEMILNKTNINLINFKYPKYEYHDEFKNPDMYDEFIRSGSNLNYKTYSEKNTPDIRDDLYIIDLDWIKSINLKKLENEIVKFKKLFSDDL